MAHAHQPISPAPDASEPDCTATSPDGATTTAAARARLHRQRRKDGKKVIRVVIDEVAVPLKLKAMGLLPAGDNATQQELEEAAGKALEGQVLVLRS